MDVQKEWNLAGLLGFLAWAMKSPCAGMGKSIGSIQLEAARENMKFILEHNKFEKSV